MRTAARRGLPGVSRLSLACDACLLSFTSFGFVACNLPELCVCDTETLFVP